MLHLYINRDAESLENFTATMRMWWAITLLILAILIFVSIKIGWIRVAIMSIADRLTIFIYLFVPLSLISVVIVILRNIHWEV